MDVGFLPPPSEQHSPLDRLERVNDRQESLRLRGHFRALDERAVLESELLGKVRLGAISRVDLS